MALLGMVGHADLTAPADTLLATVSEPGIISVRVCNRNAAQTTIRIAIGTGASPAGTDYLEYDVPLSGNQPLERGGISVSPGEKVWVRSSLANVSVRVDGVPST